VPVGRPERRGYGKTFKIKEQTEWRHGEAVENQRLDQEQAPAGIGDQVTPTRTGIIGIR